MLSGNDENYSIVSAGSVTSTHTKAKENLSCIDSMSPPSVSAIAGEQTKAPTSQRQKTLTKVTDKAKKCSTGKTTNHKQRQSAKTKDK